MKRVKSRAEMQSQIDKERLRYMAHGGRVNYLPEEGADNKVSRQVIPRLLEQSLLMGYADAQIHNMLRQKYWVNNIGELITPRLPWIGIQFAYQLSAVSRDKVPSL